MKLNLALRVAAGAALRPLCGAMAILAPLMVRADQPAPKEFRPQFLRLCDLASTNLGAGKWQPAFFIDSYAVRALCAAYDLTGKQRLSAAADREMQQLASVVFAKKPELTQLAMFMMMSYAERLSPGAVYQNSKSGKTADEGRQKKH